MLTTCLASTLEAGDDLVIFPESHTNAPSNAPISAAALLRNDGGATAIQSFTQPSRGVLSFSGTHFFYVPGPDFNEVGLDRFSYQTGPGNPHQVTLIRGLTQNLAQGTFAELVGGQCAWANTSGPSQAADGVSLIHDPNHGCLARFDSTLNVEPVDLNDDLGNPGPPGGHTEIIIDGGNIPPFSRALPSVFVTATQNGTDRFRLIETPQGLVVEAWEIDSNPVEMAAIPMPPLRSRIGLTWWFESAPGARDGGLALQVDGVLEGRLEGLRLGSGEDLDWQFGPGGTGGTLVWVGQSKIFTSDRTPTFQPIYSNYGRVQDWDTVINPAMVTLEGTGDPFWRLTVPPAATNVALVDSSVGGSSQYNARFEVELDQLSLPNWQQVTLLGAMSTQTRQAPFSVQLRHNPTEGFQVRGVARHNVMVRRTAWESIALTAGGERPAIEIHWRTALGTTPSEWTGFFTLKVDGSDPETLETLNNSPFTLDFVRLGLMGVPMSSSGSLVVDSFDSWR